MANDRIENAAPAPDGGGDHVAKLAEECFVSSPSQLMRPTDSTGVPKDFGAGCEIGESPSATTMLAGGAAIAMQMRFMYPQPHDNPKLARM